MISLTEKYRPKTEAEFIGNKEILKELEELILSSHPTILVGKPGIGKTSAVFLMACKHGFRVSEMNASDERRKNELKTLESNLKTKSFVPTIYLIDEADGLKEQDFLAKILKTANKPVVLTANYKRKLSMSLKKVCKMLEMRPPNLYEIVNLMKRIAEAEGIVVTYNRVCSDIRASINNTFYNGSIYKEKRNEFEIVEGIFKYKKVEDINPIWLIDNVTNFYNGRDLFEAVNVICQYAIHKNKEILSSLPIARKGTPKYPYFFRRMKAQHSHK